MARFNVFRKAKSLTETQAAGASFVKFFVFVIIVGVVIYSEFMFISIIQVALPGGLGKSLALVGAVATGASVLALIAAKLLWVTPGAQIIWAWIFTGIEIFIMLMNDMLAFALHQGPVPDSLGWWLQITPASPVMALVGWIILMFLDTAQRERHRDMEMEAKKLKSEREYLEAAHASEMDLRHNHLNQVTGKLQDVMQSAVIQAQIERHAEQMVARILTDVSGINAITTVSPTQQPQPKQIAQAAQTDQLPVLPEIDTHVPSSNGNGNVHTQDGGLMEAFAKWINNVGEEPKK